MSKIVSIRTHENAPHGSSIKKKSLFDHHHSIQFKVNNDESHPTHIHSIFTFSIKIYCYFKGNGDGHFL